MAQAAATEIKISLKILVNVKANKVVFAEADKDFVDFIFRMMSLPLSNVTALLNEKAGMVGCLGPLYKSIDSLGSQYYDDYNRTSDSVLRKYNEPFVLPKTIAHYTPIGFVKRAVSYMVMDNLEVKPMSLTLIRSLIKNFDHFEEKEVQFGLQEGLTMLKASLEKQDVLTTVFLGNKN